VLLAGPVREQPHFVLGPKSPCHERGPCGAKRGAPFAATRERTLHLAETILYFFAGGGGGGAVGFAILADLM
jgi:hypothetical protein